MKQEGQQLTMTFVGLGVEEDGQPVHTLIVTSSSPSATITLTGGGTSSESSKRSFTALSEFFTCSIAEALL